MDQHALDQAALDGAAARRTKRRRALVAILLSSSLATLGAGAMSLAIFTDSDASTGAWTTGTILLSSSPTTAFSATGILPGDTGSQDITVSNDGTGDMRYAITTSATDADGKALRDELQLTINAGTCAAPGAVLYSGDLAGAFVGDPTPGDDGGDRQVNAGDPADALCFSWEFPSTAGNAFRNAATDATFTFAGEQVANNP